MIGSNTHLKNLTFLDDAKIVVDDSTKEYLYTNYSLIRIPVKVEHSFFLKKLLALLTDTKKNVHRFYEKQSFTAGGNMPISGDKYTLKNIGLYENSLKPFFDELPIFCVTFRRKSRGLVTTKEVNGFLIISGLYMIKGVSSTGIEGFLELTLPDQMYFPKNYVSFDEFNIYGDFYFQGLDKRYLNSRENLEVIFGLPSKIIHDIYKNVSLEIPVFNDYSELMSSSSGYHVYWKGHSVYLKSTGKVHHFRSNVDYIDTITTQNLQRDTPLDGFYATEDFGKVFLADSLYYPQKGVIPLAGQIIDLEPDRYVCLCTALHYGLHNGGQLASFFTRQPSSNSTYKVADLKTANYANTSLMPYIVID